PSPAACWRTSSAFATPSAIGADRGLGPRVTDRQDLPEMAVRVFPIDAAAAKTRVDAQIVLTTRRAAIDDAVRANTAEDRVEIRVAHAKAEVMALEALARGEVERQALVHEDGREVALGLGPRNAEEPGEELRAGHAVAGRHD